MSDRVNFYYRQLVTEANLDQAFDLMEEADQNYVVDNGQVGVYFGLAVAEAGVPNLTVQVSAGSAYDQTGQRMAVPSTQIVDLSVDDDAVSTTVAGGGNTKIVSVFIKFARALSNPKTDGNSATIQYDVDESYEFLVEQSTEDVAPSPVALKSDAILLADITRSFGVTAIEDSAISTSRRQWGIPAYNTGRVATAFASVAAAVAGAVTAAGTSYAGGGAWADGTTNPATTVELQLDKIVSELTAGTGAAKIGSAATGDVAATTVQGALAELASEKGNKGTTNTWTAVNTFTDSMVISSASGAKTVTHKLLSSTGASETSRMFEVYATGTPGSVAVDAAPPTDHITFYEVDAIICRQGDATNAQAAKITGAFKTVAGTVTMVGSSVEVAAHGTEGGSLALAVVGNVPVLGFAAPTFAMNIRIIVRTHSVKVAA
jgi:hypothetical protein